jgi:alpha-glucosidase
MDQPEVQNAIIAMRRIADSFEGDRVMIGEAYLPITALMAYYGVDLSGFQLPFNFHLMSTAWKAEDVAVGRGLRGGVSSRRLAELSAWEP